MIALLVQPELAAPTAEQFAEAPMLTDYELMVLTQLANGLIAKQMAPRKKYRGTRRAIAEIKKKLCAKTTYHAVAMAVARGIVQVEL